MDGIVYEQEVTIGGPTNPLVVSNVVNNTKPVLCFGDNTGQIGLQASGGSAPYKYILNGTEVASMAIPAAYSLQNTVQPYRIGASGYGGENFNGSIDEVKIWNIVKTPDQLAASNNCESQGNEPGLLRYYKFNQVETDNTIRYTKLRNQINQIKIKPAKAFALFSLTMLFSFSSCIMGKRAEEIPEELIDTDSINKNTIKDTLQMNDKKYDSLNSNLSNN